MQIEQTLKGGMMKFKALSREEFYQTPTWDEVLSKSKSSYTWEDIRDVRIAVGLSATRDWDFYNSHVIPMHTKLGRYLYGIENETAE